MMAGLGPAQNSLQSPYNPLEAQSEITLYPAKEIRDLAAVNRLIALLTGRSSAASGLWPTPPSRRRPPYLSVAAARTPVGCARTTRTNRGVVRKINAVAVLGTPCPHCNISHDGAANPR